MNTLKNLLSKLWLIILLAHISCSVKSQNEVTIIPKSYTAYHTDEPVIIDGIAEEASWQKAPWSDNFIDIEGVKTPTYQTNVKMMWDDDYLYFYAELKEPHIWGDITKRDTVIFYNKYGLGFIFNQALQRSWNRFG